MKTESGTAARPGRLAAARRTGKGRLGRVLERVLFGLSAVLWCLVVVGGAVRDFRPEQHGTFGYLAIGTLMAALILNTRRAIIRRIDKAARDLKRRNVEVLAQGILAGMTEDDEPDDGEALDDPAAPAGVTHLRARARSLSANSRTMVSPPAARYSATSSALS